MDKWLAMTVFDKVVDLGSFVRAAEALGLSTTAVSRHVSELESHLGTRLLQRTTRSLHLTEAGTLFHQQGRHLLEELAGIETEMLRSNQEPNGLLRISAPVPFGARHLSPMLARFQAKYPAVKVEIVASDQKLDLVTEGLDLVLRITYELDGSMVARPITQIRTLICASPDYLARYGVPQHPADLEQHQCLVYTGTADPNIWRFYSSDGSEHKVKVSGGLSANNGDVLRGAAVEGIGITRQPTFLLGDALAKGQLVPLLEDYQMPVLTLYAMYPSRRFLSAKVRKMVEFLLEEWGGDLPPWERDWGCRKSACQK